MTDHKGLPVHTYVPQSQEKIDLVNKGKILEEQVLRYIEEVAQAGMSIDPRWLATGQTDIQKGFMAVFRCVFQPQRIDGEL